MIDKMHTAVERSLALAEKQLKSYKGRSALEERQKDKIESLKSQLAQLEKMMGDEDE